MFLKLDLLDIYQQEQMLVYFLIMNSIFAGHAYEGRKARLLSGWEQLQPELHSAFYALQAPATHECTSYHVKQDEVIRCRIVGLLHTYAVHAASRHTSMLCYITPRDEQLVYQYI